MTDLVLSDRSLDALKLDAVIVGVASRDDELVVLEGAEQLDPDALVEMLVALGAKGSDGEVTKTVLPGGPAPVVIAVGLGALGGDDAAHPEPIDTERVRKAAGAAIRATKGMSHVAITLAGVNGEYDAELVQAVGEGVMLGGYTFGEYKSEQPKASELPATRVSVIVDKARATANTSALKRAVKISEAVAMARDFVNTPPNDLYPDSFAKRAKALAQQLGVKTEILDERRLASGGYGGILAVGGGSDRKPRLLRLSWTPTGIKRGTPSVALVGKGITFDTGGISIKPAAKMDLMKTDMSGAAAVMAATLLVAALELPIKVVATIPLAENMPSGSAYRPADVVTHRGGKRSEILNTDAEGRVVLADAIARACEDGPDYLIETSTLTGAQVVALGERTAGVMGSEEFRDRVAGAGTCVGEAAWPMPLPQDVRDGMKSKTADIANIGTGPGGMLAAGHYLKEFVTDGVQWAHIDIAGPSYNSGGAYGYVAEGATGAPVRTILHVIEDILTAG
ncbi:leucyl aminopeptidase [Blastococcus sp. Marseille-P5729]|uniref:leucyl aminopeptidase n=1 Tax=Blastococcus sp. Marseille-P5729 TaxID=2086582 RepID=UPI000D0E67C9|nr:leucyl aminopeptidase [Blastococcus sp. Marseille-P5729]